LGNGNVCEIGNVPISWSRHFGIEGCVSRQNLTKHRRWDMNNLSMEFEKLLGHAAFRLWPDLPRDVQEKLFETAVPHSPLMRYSFAVFLHDHHPRTAHPPKPDVTPG
jgi:hypothetical protein